MTIDKSDTGIGCFVYIKKGPNTMTYHCIGHIFGLLNLIQKMMEVR